MITYKVWVCVERCDDETDKYEDIDLDFSATAEFKRAKPAVEFAEKLNAIGVEVAK